MPLASDDPSNLAPLPRIHELFDHCLRSEFEFATLSDLRQTLDEWRQDPLPIEIELPNPALVGEEDDVLLEFVDLAQEVEQRLVGGDDLGGVGAGRLVDAAVE